MQTARAESNGFSIVIPTWNNLSYLKLCIASIKANSAFSHEIIVHVNDGSDGTLDWVREQGLAHTSSSANLGVAVSLNLGASAASGPWLLYLNDDMWVLPGWDTALAAEIENAGTDRVFLCSRLIQPKDTGDSRVIVLDCGTGPSDFDEAKLMAHYRYPSRGDERFVFSQPTLVHRTLWQAVGGYSIEFSPGMSTDDDFVMKLWTVGCRDFRLVDASRIYHFACCSTGRIRKNKGSRTFLLKWGLRWRRFRDARGAGWATRATSSDRLWRAWYALTTDHPIGDVEAWNTKAEWDWSDGRPRGDAS